MLETAEVRWFGRGEVPPALQSWFRCAARPPETRDDHYLLSGSAAIGLKLRWRHFECKRRLGSPHARAFGDHVSGIVERWGKWSMLLDAAAPSSRDLLGPDALWATVAKHRWLRMFSPTPAGVVEVSIDDPPASRIGLEVTRLQLEGEIWWTLAAEAAVDGRDPAAALSACDRLIGGLATGDLLNMKTSLSYPGWLIHRRRFAGSA